MIKPFTVFVSIVVVIAVALFFPQILQATQGMSVLEMLQQAVGFVLHVIVVSILAYAAYAVVEIVHPLLKTFRQKQRQVRRSIRGRRTTAHPVRQASAPRATRKDEGLLWLISQLARDQRNQQKKQNGISPSSKDQIHWN